MIVDRYKVSQNKIAYRKFDNCEYFQLQEALIQMENKMEALEVFN